MSGKIDENTRIFPQSLLFHQLQRLPQAPNRFRKPAQHTRFNIIRPGQTRLNRGSAKRAVRVRTEPRINAMGVKSVAAARESTALVAGGELRHAHGAAVSGGGGGRRVCEGGEGGEEGRAKAPVVQNGGGVGRNTVAVTAVVTATTEA